jgi:hypothetical protein
MRKTHLCGRAEAAMQRILPTALALALGISAQAGRAENTASTLPKMYVGTFQPVTQTSSGFGPLHAIRTDLHRIKADQNAARLSKALAEALKKQQLSAELLPSGGAEPATGWLVQGVYYALDDHSGLITVPLLNASKGPNVEVTITIADYAKDPDTPFAVLGTDAALKGQGAAVGWNPYVVAAHFVVNKVQGQNSLDSLADEIAHKILDNRDALLGHDSPK